jgi:hypothetical protein
MANKHYGDKQFKLDKNIYIDCWTYETRYSWGHKAELYINNELVSEKKITYYNRTWEAYTYQSILGYIVEKYSGFTKKQKVKYNSMIQSDSFSQDKDVFKTVAMVAKMGEIFGNTQKESNDWKARMLKAGLENKGLIMPSDWNSLTEEEKQHRLDGVIKILQQ